VAESGIRYHPRILSDAGGKLTAFIGEIFQDGIKSKAMGRSWRLRAANIGAESDERVARLYE